jgi:hypothetical protein
MKTKIFSIIFFAFFFGRCFGGLLGKVRSMSQKIIPKATGQVAQPQTQEVYYEPMAQQQPHTSMYGQYVPQPQQQPQHQAQQQPQSCQICQCQPC